MMGLKRDLWLLFAFNLAIGFSNQFVQPLFPLFLDGLGASEIQIGLILSAASVVGTILMIPSGVVMNKIGKRKMFLLSIILSSIPTFSIALVNQLTIVTPLYILYNTSFSFFIIARMAMIAENTTPNNRATVFGLMNIAWPLAGIIAPTLSGFIIENYGWNLIFFITSFIMVASIGSIVLMKEQPTPITFIQEETVTESIRDKKYLPFMLLISLFHITAGTAEGAVGTILPLYLKNQILLSTSIIGLFFTISSIVMLLIQIPSGWLADKYGRKKVLIGCLLPLPILFGTWLFISNWEILLVIYTISAALWSMSWPSSVALLSDNLPSELVAQAVGIRMTSIRLGQTFGPLMAGYLYSFVSFNSTFLASSILLTIAIVMISMLREKS